MRYAGHHLIRHIDDTTKEDELRKAANHCKRALFDAYEAGILYDLVLFKKFKVDYSNSVVSSVVSDWIEIQKQVEEIKEFTIQYGKIDLDDRDTHDPEKVDSDENPRVQHFEECERCFLNMRDISKKLEYSRDDLNNIIKKEQRNWMLAIVTFVLGVLMFLGFGLNSYWDKETAASQIKTPPQLKQTVNP